MKNLSKKGGISLVALVITIIVLIILTGAVIVTFMEGGIIDRAKEATFKSDIRTYQEILAIKKADEYIDIATGKKDNSDLNADTIDKIQGIIPEFKKDYEGIVAIVDGELMLAEGYEEKATQKQQEWLKELGLGEQPWDNSYAEVLNIVNGVVYGFKDDTRESKTSGEYQVPSEYANLVIPEGVTSIDYFSFYGCKGLKSVKIPSTVTRINSAAFSHSTITNAKFSNGVTALGIGVFDGCTALESVKLPNTLESIDYMVFQNCTSLKTITIPASVTVMGDDVFKGCTALESVILEPGSKLDIKDASRWGITDSSIITRTYLEGLNIVDGVLYGFNDDIRTTKDSTTIYQVPTQAENLVIPEGVTSIDGAAFINCKGLKTVKMPSTLKTIGGSTGAFLGCTELTKVELNEGLEKIDGVAFSGCTSLKTIDLPSTLNTIEWTAFQGTGITSIEIPNSVTRIGAGVFQNCTSLETVKLSNELKSIGMFAFSGCTSLRTITIPASVTSIDMNIFAGCTALESVIIEEGSTLDISNASNWGITDSSIITKK